MKDCGRAQAHHGVIRALDGMADGPRVFVDLVVVAALVALVAEEVDLLETFLFDMLKGISFIPACARSRTDQFVS